VSSADPFFHTMLSAYSVDVVGAAAAGAAAGVKAASSSGESAAVVSALLAGAGLGPFVQYDPLVAGDALVAEVTFIASAAHCLVLCCADNIDKLFLRQRHSPAR
jgi:hypothetical protein